jgi:polysaccharide biosynthesis protein PslH
LAASALLLVPEAPFPVAGGGALRTASLLHYVAARYPTDVIVFREPAAEDPRRLFPRDLVRNITVIDLPRHRRDLPSRVWRNALRLARRAPPLVDRFAGFGDAVARAVAGREYRIGVIEHLWCAPYLAQISPACAFTVLDLHNVESVLHRRSASEGAATGWAHRVFARAACRLEQTWLPRFHLVLAASGEDAGVARAIAPGARLSVYPNAIPLRPMPEPADDEAIVFSGNLEYQPNRAAVRFFAREVWPGLRRQWPGLRWRLVGRNPHAIRQFVDGDPRIEISGPIEDAVAELARSRVAVVPLLAASGTRFKILEAWAAGVPVVSTPLGAEGLGAHDGEELLLADGATAFIAAVSRLLKCKQLRHSLAQRARRLLEKEFTWEKAWGKLPF